VKCRKRNQRTREYKIKNERDHEDKCHGRQFNNKINSMSTFLRVNECRILKKALNMR
jgi:hypothetical protein